MAHRVKSRPTTKRRAGRRGSRRKRRQVAVAARQAGHYCSVPSRVDALFRANGGGATAAQLRGLGFTEARLRRLSRQGKLVAVRRGVYAASVHIAWAKLDPARWQAFLLAAV